MVHCKPYQSCSLFGAMRYFSNIRNSVSLINGPSGCTFYTNNSIVRLNGYFNASSKVEIPRIYCIDFNEKDAIVGSEKKLFVAAEELIERYNPELLLLFNCCVSEIVGSDVDSVAEELSIKYRNVLIIPFHTAGFKGDHKFGMHLAIDSLLKYIYYDETVTKINEKSVNILGEFDYFNRATIELCELLKDIGIEKINFIPGKSSLSELKEAKNSALNIITCQNASKYLAMRMEKRFKIPWIGDANSLYGINNSYNFYREIFEFFGVGFEKVTEMKERALDKIVVFKNLLYGKRAVVVASTRRALGYSQVLNELGVSVDLIFSEGDNSYISKKDFLQYSKNVIFNEYANELSERIEKLHVDYVFTTLPELVAPIKYIQRPEIDYSGMDGVVRMGEYLCKLSNDTGNKIIIND